MDSISFGLKIKSQRQKLGITQAYLAALSNTGTRFISDLENGKKTIQLDKALYVAHVLSLKVTIDE